MKQPFLTGLQNLQDLQNCSHGVVSPCRDSRQRRPVKAMPARLVVSLHDVSPLTWEVCTHILTDLQDAGIAKTSLLVVPNHHHRAAVRSHPAFAAWLREQAAVGHEIVLHGYHHTRKPRPRESLLAKLVNSFYTAGEGEFYDMPHDEARHLLVCGREDLCACGVECEGFIAPAWLLGAEARQALADEGFRYTTRLKGIEPISSSFLPTQSLVWSTRSEWRRTVSLAWNRLMVFRLAWNPIMRIGIHPPDWSYSKIRCQILKIAARATTSRTVSTYHDCVTSF